MRRYDCKSTSELMSQAQERALSPGERLALGAHLLICRRCRRFREQLAFIRRACRRLADSLPPDR